MDYLFSLKRNMVRDKTSSTVNRCKRVGSKHKMPVQSPIVGSTNVLSVYRLVLGVIIAWQAVIATSSYNGVGGVPDSSEKPVHKRFEYKYSFKPPYLAQKDGTVPFFEYSGSK